jgi:hypothetical protein
MDTFRVDIISRDSSSIDFILIDINRSPSTDWVSTDVSVIPTHRAPADWLSVDINTTSADWLVDDSNDDALADGSSSDDIVTSSTNRLTDKSLSEDADTSADQPSDRSLAEDANTSGVVDR